MKTYYAYIRVSTARQGEEGVSLQEQKSAILEYASKRSIIISEWFEEQETAAKRGRPVFTKVVNMLKRKKAGGIIIHKIDRGARNLRDWADIAELMDSGIEVHFAHESIDLHTRSGRLSADILAVVASDYIRNLREETIKGINGRLRQGLWPFGAPIGYLNHGKGKVKTVDPVRGPLIKQAFELYATRDYSLADLEEELFSRGLRTRSGKKVNHSHLSMILKTPFYMGLMRIRGRKDMHPGIHAPLITSSVFNEVQAILTGRRGTLKQFNRFIFSRMVRCEHCKLFFVGERQRTHIYYRCHRTECPRGSIREERFQEAVIHTLKKINITPDEEPVLAEALLDFKTKSSEVSNTIERNLAVELEQVRESIKTLLQKYLENNISKDVFDEGHGSFLMQRKILEERIAKLSTDHEMYPKVQELLSHFRSLCERFCTGSLDEMRGIIETVFQSVTASGIEIRLTLSPFMEQIARREKTKEGWQNLLPIMAKELSLSQNSLNK